MVYRDKPFFQYYILVFYRKLVKLDLHICKVSRVWQWQNWTPPSFSRGGLCVQAVQVWKQVRTRAAKRICPSYAPWFFPQHLQMKYKATGSGKSWARLGKYLRRGSSSSRVRGGHLLSSCYGELLVHHQFGLGFNGLVNWTGTPWFTTDCARTS